MTGGKMMTTNDEPGTAVRQLWYTRCPVPTASGVALDLGWLDREFARDGIALASVRASDDRAIRLAHYHHKLPGLFREGGNIPAIWARSQGEDTKVVALTWVDEYQAVLASPGTGIRAPADLEGCRIAVPRHEGDRVDFSRAMALHGIVSTLALGGLTLNDVEILDIVSAQHDLRPSDANRDFHNPEVAAVVDGRADAVYVKGAVGAGLAREHGLHTIVNLGEHPDPLVRVNNGNPRPVTVDRRTAEERPDLVSRYLSTLIRAADWARVNGDAVVDIVAKEVGRSTDDVRVGYGAKLQHSFGLDLSPLRRTSLAAQKDFLLAHGFIPHDFDVAEWIDPMPLALATGLPAQVA
jgi:sulfonate transport system substrate-binding protein